jgi:four helix bundle protein
MASDKTVTGTETVTVTATVTGKDGGGGRETGRSGPEVQLGPAESADGYLPHERLDVYRVAVELHRALTASLPRRCSRELRDQLIRASTSVVLNIAEGAGRTAIADKRRFYEIAKGSATECAAVLDLIRLSGGGDSRTRERARRLSIRVVQMLTRLCGGPR